jgi:hypothetical protein
LAWIKTIPDEASDERLKNALASQHARYPPEYDEPIQGLNEGLPGTPQDRGRPLQRDPQPALPARSPGHGRL